MWFVAVRLQARREDLNGPCPLPPTNQLLSDLQVHVCSGVVFEDLCKQIEFWFSKGQGLLRDELEGHVLCAHRY